LCVMEHGADPEIGAAADPAEDVPPAALAEPMPGVRRAARLFAAARLYAEARDNGSRPSRALDTVLAGLAPDPAMRRALAGAFRHLHLDGTSDAETV
jgi:hypothetical protein